MSAPVRIQISRRKGWRMPDNTVVVSRPGKWGNPYAPLADGLAVQSNEGDGRVDRYPTKRDAIAACVEQYRKWVEPHAAIIREDLRGKNLACWCQLDQPCHADVLLELANAPEPTP